MGQACGLRAIFERSVARHRSSKHAIGGERSNCAVGVPPLHL